MNAPIISALESALPQLKIYPASQLEQDGVVYLLGKNGCARTLIAAGNAIPEEFNGEDITAEALDIPVKSWSDASAAAAFLRNLFPHLKPQVFGTEPGFGCGDRLGLASPAHIQAVKDSGFHPMLAQQSMRENSRTGRSMQDVIDDATWGTFECGYTAGFGADADHIKEPADIAKAIDVGFTFFTVDPSDHVRDEIAGLDNNSVQAQYDALENIADIKAKYEGKEYAIPGLESAIVLAGDEFQRAVLTYSKAIDHLGTCYKLLVEKRGLGKFDFEASVDETETPTTPMAHIYIVEELKARGIGFHSLALRFVGEFQKGIDYIGDIPYFESQFKQHVAIANYFGGYKLGIHSGSDKFSIYPIISKLSGNNLHVKTAGTSWLEAVHTVAKADPVLYRKLHTLALENFEKDRASYHVTTDLTKIKPLDQVTDNELDNYLTQNDARQLLHITYGSILNAENGAVGKELYDFLAREEKLHYKLLTAHIGKHTQKLQ